ncbi:MAG: response regulator [Anaerolineales bacterium]|nr:response regulator [Anaerolineales bacterium]
MAYLIFMHANFARMNISRKQILLVEDNHFMRDTIARMLELEHFEVFIAENGLDGLEILKKVRPDLILSDINMPAMDGITFYKTMRAIPALAAIPFIFLTANDAPEAIQEGRELGVEDYLTKPVETKDLLAIINARLLRVADVQIAHIGQAYLDTVTILANSIEGRDPYTFGHVERVTKYARWMGEALNWSSKRMRGLEFGARLHDIGKIVVPDNVLKKAGPLSQSEWNLMQQHPTRGVKIIHEIKLLRETIPYILCHHEKWDGTGYPNRLKGEEIPLEGRLLAIVDVFDALTTARPYRAARKLEEVVHVLRKGAGTHFDPYLAGVFLEKILPRYMAEVENPPA